MISSQSVNSIYILANRKGHANIRFVYCQERSSASHQTRRAPRQSRRDIHKSLLTGGKEIDKWAIDHATATRKILKRVKRVTIDVESSRSTRRLTLRRLWTSMYR